MSTDLNSRAVTFIERKFNPVSRNNGWYECDCWYCGRRMKMGYNYDLAYYKCWACPAKGTLLSHVMDVAEKPTYREVTEFLRGFDPTHITPITRLARAAGKARVYTVKNVRKYPTGFVPLYLAEDYSSGKRVLEYLASIKLDPTALAAKGFGYVPASAISPWSNRLIIPFYKDFQLVYYIGRSLGNSPKRYMNFKDDDHTIGTSDLLYNEQAIYLYETIKMVEGWADAETLGDDAVGYLSANVTDKQWRLLYNSNVKNLVFFPDKGWYDSVKQQCLPHLDRFNITIADTRLLHKYDGKDVNDWGKDLALFTLEASEPLTYANYFL